VEIIVSTREGTNDFDNGNFPWYPSTVNTVKYSIQQPQKSECLPTRYFVLFENINGGICILCTI
ncbi:MAG: hypothetical protein ABIU77_18170, partial [Ferruginibacter sp.]